MRLDLHFCLSLQALEGFSIGYGAGWSDESAAYSGEPGCKYWHRMRSTSQQTFLALCSAAQPRRLMPSRL
jgi:hypothetical protein